MIPRHFFSTYNLNTLLQIEQINCKNNMCNHWRGVTLPWNPSWNQKIRPFLSRYEDSCMLLYEFDCIINKTKRTIKRAYLTSIKMCENLITNTQVEFTIFFSKKNKKRNKRKTMPNLTLVWMPCGSESVPNEPLYSALERQVLTTL